MTAHQQLWLCRTSWTVDNGMARHTTHFTYWLIGRCLLTHIYCQWRWCGGSGGACTWRPPQLSTYSDIKKSAQSICMYMSKHRIFTTMLLQCANLSMYIRTPEAVLTGLAFNFGTSAYIMERQWWKEQQQILATRTTLRRGMCRTIVLYCWCMYLPELLRHSCNDIHQPGLGCQPVATGDLCL